jgi:hypothetical protein
MEKCFISLYIQFSFCSVSQKFAPWMQAIDCSDVKYPKYANINPI